MTLRDRLPILPCLLVLVAAAGCTSLIDLDVEVPRVCVQFTGLKIDGAPTSMITASFVDSDLGAFNGMVSLDAQIDALQVQVTAVTGVTDLSFLEHVTLSLGAADSTSTLPVVQLLDCADSACASSTR